MERVSSAVSVLLRPVFAPDSGVRMDRPEQQMLDVCTDCIKVISPNGLLLHVNLAGCNALGLSPESGFGVPWVPLLAPEIHQDAYQALAEASDGHSVRFAGRSGSGDSLVHWDNLLTPMVSDDGEVKAILCVSRDVTEQKRLQEDMRAAIEREKILTQEMRHRVKNLYSLVSGLITMTEREVQPGPEIQEFSATIKGRLIALARASDATFTASAIAAGQDYAGDLGDIIAAVLQPYTGRLTISGPKTPICAKNITSLAIVFHELATNSMKYGAIGESLGLVELGWSHVGKDVLIHWRERGAQYTAQPARLGFGTSVMERSLKAIGGTITLNWSAGGLHAEIKMPRAELDHQAA